MIPAPTTSCAKKLRVYHASLQHHSIETHVIYIHLFAYFFSFSNSESGGPLIPASRPAIHLTVFGFIRGGFRTKRASATMQTRKTKKKEEFGRKKESTNRIEKRARTRKTTKTTRDGRNRQQRPRRAAGHRRHRRPNPPAAVQPRQTTWCTQHTCTQIINSTSARRGECPPQWGPGGRATS